MTFASPSPRQGIARALRQACAPAVLALAVAAAPAAATVYYVSPNGSSSNSGTSQASPWSLSKANGSLLPGDVCILLPGSYATAVQPTVSGTGPTARITFVGSLASPAATQVAGVAINKAWITVKGVQAASELATDYPARYDSIAYCTGLGGHFYGVKYSVIAHCSINGTFSFLQDLAQAMGGTANCEYDTLRGNAINLGAIPATHGFKIRGFSQNCLLDSNRVVGTFTQTGTNDGCGRIFYNSSYNTLRDNYWQLDATNAYNANGDPWNGFVLRDSASHYTFVRDTCYLGLGNPSVGVRGVLCSSGTYPGSVGNNVWQNCVFKTDAYIWVQNGLRNVTLSHCSIASSGGNALWFTSSLESSVIDHCTFWAHDQVISYGDVFAGSGNQITSNIFYSQAAGPIGTGGAEVMYPAIATTNFTQNNNLFFTPAFTSRPGDRSLEWCCYTGSAPGAGTPWAQLNGQDVNSTYGSPMFVDSTFSSLDTHLRLGSLAIGVGAGATDAGAFPFGGVPVDVTPPAAVADLDSASVTAQSLILTWTAPGDNGTSGLAAAYDLRMSTAPITAANFAAATQVSPQPIPQYGGTAQNYVVLGLAGNTGYWFAIKTRDAAGNWSGLSNVLAVTTRAADTTPPAAVQDLSAGP